MLERLESIEKRYGELERLMAQPEVVTDLAQLQKLAQERASIEELVTKYRTRFSGCYACPYQCTGKYKVPGLGAGAASCAQWLYGAFDHEDARAVWESNALMQRLGLDNYSIEAIISFLYLCKKEGALTETDFNDLGIPVSKFLGGMATGHEFLQALLHPMADGSSIFSDGLPE